MDTNKLSYEELLSYTKQYISILPGVSDTLLFYTVMSELAEYLPDKYQFTAILTGRRASLKTSFARKLIKKENELKFYNLKGNIFEILDSFEGNVLIDDVYAFKDYRRRNFMSDVFNAITRQSDPAVRNGSNVVIITAESIPTQIIASGRDRIFELPIREKVCTSEFKERAWKTLSAIPEDFIAELEECYATQLKENKEMVDFLIRDFLDNYQTPAELDYQTRFVLHSKFLILSELIFTKVFCNGIPLHDVQEYQKRVVAGAVRQHKYVLMCDKRDKENNLAVATYKLIQANKYFEICYDPKKYVPGGKRVLMKEGCMWVWSKVLLSALREMLGQNINDDVLRGALRETGALIQERANVATVSTSYKTETGEKPRHFVIDVLSLKNYASLICDLDDLSDLDDFTVEVVRRRG